MTTTILALDLGTTTGWSLRSRDGLISGGSESFKPQRFDGGGMRYLRFKRWLTDIKQCADGLDWVLFEEKCLTKCKPYPTTMAQTRDFKETVAARVKSDPAFAQALLDEALTLFIGGDPDTAKLILSDLANAGCGLESLESIQNVEQAAKLKALRDAVAVGLASGPDIEAAEVFDRLEARLLAMAQNRE